MFAPLLLVVAATLGQECKSYADPKGSFALEIPAGWTAQRQDLGDGATLTELCSPTAPDGAHFDVIVQRLPRSTSAAQRSQASEELLEGVLLLVGAEARITKQVRTEVTIAGRNAPRVDLEFRDTAGARWKGWVLTTAGERHVFALMPHARAQDTKTLELLARCAATFAPESRKPLESGQAGLAGSRMTDASLAVLAARVKNDMRREPAESVLAAGPTPLTYGSVANFVTVIELLFDVQLTEAEFEATRARFVEFYGKSDDEGKRVLAEQGASLLASLTSGSEEEIENSRREGRAVFEEAFRRGAEAGIGYAEVMWQAVERRRKTLATTGAKPGRAGFDAEITEGDVDATMELLCFMWVAAGRDPSDVTVGDVARIRAELVGSLPTLDSQAALLVANAPKVYAGLRQQWQGASPELRQQLAVQCGRALDEWGLGASSGFEQQASGGSDANGDSLNAQIAQNTAWNAAKTW